MACTMQWRRTAAWPWSASIGARSMSWPRCCASVSSASPAEPPLRLAAILEQVRGEGAQRAELPADQRQLGLHQALLVVQRIRALFQFGGQLFFGIALNRHRTLFGQASGDFVEAGGQALGAVRQRALPVAKDNLTAVRAKAREITQEGV